MGRISSANITEGSGGQLNYVTERLPLILSSTDDFVAATYISIFHSSSTRCQRPVHHKAVTGSRSHRDTNPQSCLQNRKSNFCFVMSNIFEHYRVEHPYSFRVKECLKSGQVVIGILSRNLQIIGFVRREHRSDSGAHWLGNWNSRFSRSRFFGLSRNLLESFAPSRCPCNNPTA